VLASGIVRDPWMDRIDYQIHRPERLLVNGVRGFSTEILFFLVEGRGEMTIRYDSVKGGTHSRRFRTP
jgi:hypothetical protein